MMKSIFYLSFSLLASHFCFGQDSGGSNAYKGKEKLKRENKYWTIGSGIYSTHYFGDLNPIGNNTYFNNRSTDVSLSFDLQYTLTSQVSIEYCLAWVRLTSDDYYLANTNTPDGINNYIRNLSFRNDLFELTTKAKFYFNKNGYSFRERPFFNPYIFIGLGVAYHNPKARVPEFNMNNERFINAGDWSSLKPLGTEGQQSEYINVKTYSYFQPIIPVGLGLTFKINPYFDMSFEVSYRYTFTDFLDDVSGDYVDLGTLEGDLAKSLSYRAEEINSSNGRNPRNFELINSNTDPIVYSSQYDGQIYQVLEGYGNEGDKRGDNQKTDFYILAGFKVKYVLAGKKEK